MSAEDVEPQCGRWVMALPWFSVRRAAAEIATLTMSTLSSEGGGHSGLPPQAPVRPTQSSRHARAVKIAARIGLRPVRNDGHRSKRRAGLRNPAEHRASSPIRTSLGVVSSGTRLVCTGTRGARPNSSGCAAATSARDAWNLWRSSATCSRWSGVRPSFVDPPCGQPAS